MIRKSIKKTEIGIIPEDWEVMKLVSVANVIDPHPSHRAPKEYIDGIPFVGIGDLGRNGDFIGNKYRLVNSEVYIDHRKRYQIERGLLALGRVASIGKVVNLKYLKEIYTISPTLGIIDPQIINKELLFYLLDSRYTKKQFIKVMSGSTRNSVGMEVLRELLVAFPKDSKEQTAIANVLSDTDALIESFEKLIEKKKQIKQGAMQELLTGKKRLPGFAPKNPKYKKTEVGIIPEDWEVQELGKIAKINMGQSPSSIYYNTTGIGLPLIQGNADMKIRKTIKKYYTSQITKTCFSGDIIMSVRAPVGTVAKTDFDGCIGRGVCSISYPNNYLYYYLIYMEKSWSKYSTGSTFDSINSDTLENIFVGLPNLSEQIAIANLLSDADTEIEELENKLKKYKDIKQGMMQKLLTGQIRLLEDKP